MQMMTKFQSNINLYLYNYTSAMNLIGLTERQEYKIILMRRSFFRIATTIAHSKNVFCMSNGENLGQVASQTPESMHTIQNSTDLLVLRPLSTYSKNEIIDKSRLYNFHDISIRQVAEACELFAPRNPVTKPRIAVAEKLEKSLDNLLEFEEKIITDGELITFH
jgi:thiamine biosynthesis protein ThiI